MLILKDCVETEYRSKPAGGSRRCRLKEHENVSPCCRPPTVGVIAADISSSFGRYVDVNLKRIMCLKHCTPAGTRLLPWFIQTLTSPTLPRARSSVERIAGVKRHRLVIGY